jgi:hypothetical protein
MDFTPTLLGDVLLFALLGVMVAHGLWQARRGRWQLLDPLNFFFIGMVMVFVVQLLQDGKTLIEWHGTPVLHNTLLAAIFVTAMAIVGYEAHSAVRVGWRLPSIAPRLDPGRLNLLAWFIIAAGLFGYALVFYRVGGMNEFLAVGRGWATPVRNLPYVPAFLQTLVMQLPSVLPVGCYLLLFRAYMYPLPPGTRLLAWAINGLMWAWFLYLGTRSRLTWVTLAMMAAFFLPRRKTPPLWLGGAVFAALILLTSFQAHYRAQFVNLSFNLTEEQKEEVWDRILPSFLLPEAKQQERILSVSSELNCAMTAIKLVPGEVPYNYGYGWLELFTRWIPRAVWPSKRYPHLESMQGLLSEGGLSDHRDERTGLLGGPAFSIVGHWYNAGGILGLALGGWLAGFIVRIVRTLYDRSAQNQSFLLLYPPLMLVGFLDACGTPFYWAFYVPFTLAPTVVALWFCRARSPAPVRREAETRRRRLRDRRSSSPAGISSPKGV